ncbi:MAG: tRNA (N6-threonylcarbamoyladenosine(37)-N6)-methyltransferase TrmO [Desulfonatronovibrio sp. MSAO_Bac4]|nr:MAG: tRNA (N6-threonylcarbamoyladenosine(37)-N6)-methyltransferase TrmO [Desulfonatronovibrio sp. MSAO_Bac4]
MTTNSCTSQDFKVQPIGQVESPYLSLKDCPFQGNDACPAVQIHIKPELSKGLHLLKAGQEIIVITFMDKSQRNILQCKPRNDPDKPLHGVFATRSPNRPNPLGLHQVKILAISENTLTVHPLEVLDKTPVLDIKPVLKSGNLPHEIEKHFSKQEIYSLIHASSQAFSKGLLNGLNGNLSLKKNGLVLITASNQAKGSLNLKSLCVLDEATGKVVAGEARPSTESEMHLRIYRNQPKAKAIAHTHPVNILALSEAYGKFSLQNINLFEGKELISKIDYVHGHKPGSLELARDVGLSAVNHQCIVMNSHGLACWGENIHQAVAITDELEALAKIEFKTILLKS